MTKIKYDTTRKFEKDLKKLKKKFHTLESDSETLKDNAIRLFHLFNIDNHGIFEIKGAGNTKKLSFFKVKKIACRSLKGRGVRSGLRLIYAYFPQEQEIVFLEFYFKQDQANENPERISDFLKDLN